MAEHNRSVKRLLDPEVTLLLSRAYSFNNVKSEQQTMK